MKFNWDIEYIDAEGDWGVYFFTGTAQELGEILQKMIDAGAREFEILQDIG